MTTPRILFLDQTGALGGGELALRDMVMPYRDRCRVVLFADGPLRPLLEGDGVAVTVVDTGLTSVRRESGIRRALVAAPGFARLVRRVAGLARGHDLIYANSQKALLVGAVAARLSGRALVSHLHDILTPAHFSGPNRWLSVTAANRACHRVIADSLATADAFVAAGGRSELVDVVYYGFDPPGPPAPGGRSAIRAELAIDDDAFVVGHVGRLSPWKGQDVLVQAMADVPDATGLIVGGALFGEDDLNRSLPALAGRLGVDDRMIFVGFRRDVPDVMRACDVLVHSSTSPEPFGRVIVEAMLAGVPVVAAGAGGPCEIIEDGVTGWLTTPGDVGELAARLRAAQQRPDERERVAAAGLESARHRFTMEAMHTGLATVIEEAVDGSGAVTPRRRRRPQWRRTGGTGR